MNKKIVTGEQNGQEGGPQRSYAGYVQNGGRINEEDYRSVLLRAQNGKVSEGARHQAEGIARFSGIALDTFQSHIDPRALYGVLRSDTEPTPPTNVRHHHSQMSDQELFMEMLRMLEEGDAIRLVENAYPNIFH